MKYIFKLALRNTFFNKKKTAAAIAGFFLCSLFFALEITLIYSYAVDNNNSLEHTFGLHDGIYCAAEAGMEDITRSADIEKSGVIQVYFISDNTSARTNRKLVAGTFDKNAKELCRLQVISGRFPASDNEIMLEKSLLSVMFCGKDIGEEVELMVGGILQNFIICGIYDNISMLQWDADEFNVPFVNAIVINGFREKAEYYFVPVILGGTEVSFDNTMFCANRRSDYDVLSVISGVNSDNGIVLLISVLSLFSLVVMIALSFIAKKGEEKTIGLWKSVGFSVKDVFLFYFAKLLITAVPALFIGSFAGYGTGVALGGRSSRIIVGLLCFIASLFVMSASFFIFIGTENHKCVVENLRHSAKCKELHSSEFTTDNPVLLYSIKNYIINAKEIAAAGISLFLAVFILVISSSVMINAQNYLAESERAYDVLLNFEPRTVTALNISLYGEAGLSEEEYALLKEKTDEVIGVKSLYVYEITDGSESLDEYNEDYLRDKERLGFPSNHLISGRILGVDNDIIEELQKYTVSGNINLGELEDGKTIILCKTSENEFSYSVGDRINLAYAINENPENPSYDEISYHELEVTVGALVDIPDSEKLLAECIRGGFIWSEKAFDAVNIEKNYSNIYSKIGVDDSGFYELVNEFKSYYGKLLNLYDFSQERASYEQFFSSFRTVSLIISIGLSVFSIVNCAITALSRIARRKNIFGSLRAIGLTKWQMAEIIFIENAFSAIVSSVLGIVCGIIIILIMNTPVSGFALVFLLILGELTFIAGISCAAADKCFRQSVVECISSVE